VDSVGKMAAAGVSQYLDIGSGLPTSPNVHEVARQTVPGARVVYVDYDPVVVLHSQAKRRVPGTAAVRADVRSPELIFAAPEVEELIDFDQPCGVLMMSVLHFVGGSIGPLVAQYTDRLAPGSYLALSHGVTDGVDQANLTGVQEAYEASPTDPAIRGTAAIRELFSGFELLPPGLTDVRTFTDPTFAYSPEDPAPGIWMLGAAARKL
jgi:SAM-dependent methyltransferase